MFSAAPISLWSTVQFWGWLMVDGHLAGLQGSEDRAVTVLLRHRDAASLAPYTAGTPCGPMEVPVQAPSTVLGLTASLHGLELGEGDDVCSLGSVPDCATPSRVVIVEAATLGVEQLPPLVTISLADSNTWRGIPAALSSGQVHIHAFVRTRLQDFHPVRAEGEETEKRLEKKVNNKIFTRRMHSNQFDK